MGSCTTCRATTQGWSTTHGIWIPGVPGHPSRIYPGSSGNRSSMPGIHFFSISGDPRCPDDEKVKKLSGTTFFCSGALFLSRSTFFVSGALFSRKLPISHGWPRKLRNSRFPKKTEKVGELSEIPAIPGNSWPSGVFFSGAPPKPRIQEKVQNFRILAPHAIYIERALSLYIYTGGFSIASQSKHSLSFAIAMRRSFHLYRPTDGFGCHRRENKKT